MQDLETIIRNNAKATAASIPQLRSSGKFVVALYSGLNYCSHAAFNSAAEAQDYITLRGILNEPGERTQLLEPIVADIQPTEELATIVVPQAPAAKDASLLDKQAAELDLHQPA